ncbi:hypothetical protein Rhe02_53380 [Rhizocola hellebori]|uniref:Uncharacterized protein n=1 Tax=Rhizocola hellebori TaxID=1392758 RepID=A0A8J3VIP4_9ACTN|nr:hypothetical protein [Rhizocola hellebori]GIH07271.1 hypothetical protein Rhe02_53380 [Rhizocola hellebori]
MKWLASLVLTAALIVVPQSPASAACASTRLNAPAGMTITYSTNHAGTGYIVGSGWVSNHWEGILWTNGVPQRLPNPAAGDGSNYPRAVNGSGVVAGYWVGSTGVSFGWRYTNGSYQQLPPLGTRKSLPTDMNSAGDIVGFASYLTAGDFSHVMLWKASTPSQFTDFGLGTAAGIDDTGRVVVSWGVLFNPDGTSLSLDNPGATFSVRDFAGGRIVGFKGVDAPYTVVEWNLSGHVVREIADGVPQAINASGSITATRQSGAKVLFKGATVETLTSPVPAPRITIGVTSDNVVISDANNSAYRWNC